MTPQAHDPVPACASSPVDATTRAIVDWALTKWRGELEEEVREAARFRLFDALGCLAGGHGSEPASIVRQTLAGPVDGLYSGAVLGSGHSSRLDGAVFASTVAMNYWDANDVYARSGAGHPSDVIPAATITAAHAHRSGDELLRAVVIGYEIFCALNDGLVLRSHGWDQGTWVAAACAVPVGLLLGCGGDELRAAVSLAVVPTFSLRQTRAGELSMWKACATGQAAAQAVQAVMLAQGGMTAPAAPFEGKHGVWDQLGTHFDIVALLGATASPQRIRRTNLKPFPAEHHAQSAIEAALDLHSQRAFAHEDITAIRVGTHSFALSEIADDPAKWRPENKETADHSRPFLVAAALVRGDVSRESYTPEGLKSPEVLRLLNCTSLEEIPKLSSALPDRSGARISVTTTDGTVHTAEREVASGHWSKPLSWQSLQDKVRRVCAGVATPEQLDPLARACAEVELASDATSVIRAFPKLA